MNQQEWKEKLSKEGLEVVFAVNRWGSAQYAGALAFYDLFVEIRQDLSIEETLEVLGCEVTHEGIETFDEIKRNASAYFTEEIKDVEDDDDHKNFLLERMDELAKTKTVDEIFDVLGNTAWDLWSAAPFVAHLAFKKLEFSAPTAPGTGPIGNVMAQSENFKTGLCCALLRDANLVSSDECFRGFDT